MSEEKKADARIEQIITAIQDKDKEALESLFSDKSLAESIDFVGGVEYLFDFFNGTVESWERIALSFGESIDHGERIQKLRSWYTVNTDKEKYAFLLIEFTLDTKNPDNTGLYTLRVIKDEDKDMLFPSWQKIEVAGIYKPNLSSSILPFNRLLRAAVDITSFCFSGLQRIAYKGFRYISLP